MSDFKQKIEDIAKKQTPGEYYGIMTLMLILESILRNARPEDLEVATNDIWKIAEHPKKLGLKMLGAKE